MNNIIYDTLLTGDLILFSGTNNIISNVVKYVTSSIWSHVGIVIRDPNFLINKSYVDGLYLLNSNGRYDIDIECNSTRLGVQIVDLKTCIEGYDCLIVVRHLLEINNKRDKEENKLRNDLFKEAYQTVFEKTYDYLPSHILVALLHNYGYTFADNLIDCRHTDYLFCSALIAYLYTVTGIMDRGTKWSITMPEFFSHNLHENFDLNCNGNYILSPIIVLKNTFEDDWSIIHCINIIQDKSNIKNSNNTIYNIDNHIITETNTNTNTDLVKVKLNINIANNDIFINTNIDIVDKTELTYSKIEKKSYFSCNIL